MIQERESEHPAHVYAAEILPGPVGACRTCGREIVWGLTNRGRRAPFDFPQSEDGYVNHWIMCLNPPSRKGVKQ